LALASKKGSVVVREMVQQKERLAQRRKLLQLAGTFFFSIFNSLIFLVFSSILVYFFLSP
jgi:hypothetical protein